MKRAIPWLLVGILFYIILGMYFMPARAPHGDGGIEFIEFWDNSSPLDFLSAHKAIRHTSSSSQAMAAPSQELDPKKTKIIRNASLTFKVKDYKISKAAIETLIKNNNGYISSEKESNPGYELHNEVIIRVPYQNFDKMIADLLTQSIYLYNKKMTVEDVTEKFIDTESRLNTKKQIENRYLELLKEAKNVQDIMTVEKELRVIREEIDATEGKLRYLNDQILYSTITLNYYQPVEGGKEPGPGFIKKTWEALHGGWELLIAIGYGLLYIWPIILIILLFYILIRRHRRKKREMREQK